METIVEKNYLKNNQEFQRYNSWNHCYTAFGNASLDNETLALHLGFYLASWGMYRGSSKLLERDYKVHTGVVEIIKKYFYLRNNETKTLTIDSLEIILRLIIELSKYYKKSHNVTPTDTLLSKIVLGTLGCLPVFDRFFIDGVKDQGFYFSTLKRKSLICLFDYYAEKRKEIEKIKRKYPQYPAMKLIDMYFWQIGYDNKN